MNGRIFITKDCYKPLNLKVGSDLKRFIYLAAKTRGEKVKMSHIVLEILGETFPKCNDGKWHEWIKAAAKADNRNIEGWLVEYFPEKVRPRSSGLHLLDIEERAELFHWLRKFGGTTFYYNAVGYIKREKPADLSWTLHVQQSLDSLRGYYQEVLDGNIVSDFYNPLKH